MVSISLESLHNLGPWKYFILPITKNLPCKYNDGFVKESVPFFRKCRDKFGKRLNHVNCVFILRIAEATPVTIVAGVVCPFVKN